jgi:anti-sigma regulatory factor (Ser/Thr protein kinase)
VPLRRQPPGPRGACDARQSHPILQDAEGLRPSSEYDPDRILERSNQQPLPTPPAHAHTFELRPDTTLCRARRCIINHARTLGLDGERLGDLEVAASELITSILHGGGSGLVQVWSDADHVTCEVSDSGTIRDPLAGRRPADLHRLGGRGLLLVNNLVDLVRVHSTNSGTTTRIHLRTGDAPPRAQAR